MITSSPAAAASSRRDNWLLAAWTFTIGKARELLSLAKVSPTAAVEQSGHAASFSPAAAFFDSSGRDRQVVQHQKFGRRARHQRIAEAVVITELNQNARRFEDFDHR